MNLRLITLITVACILIVVLGSFSLFAYYYNELSYSSLESDQTIQEVHGIHTTIQDEIDYLYSNVRDYAAWNDTYAFASDGNEDYIDINLREEIFSLYDIDDVLVFNRTGGLVYGKEYDRESDTEIPVPDPLVRDIARLNEIQNTVSSRNGSAGIMNSSLGLIISISHPILTDNFDGPPAGSLHFIRRIDENFYTEIREQTGKQISILTPDQLNRHYFKKPAILIPEENQVATYPYSYDTMMGITTIPDLTDRNHLVLVADIPRTIYQTGHISGIIFITLLIVASGIIIIVVIIFLDRVVFARLNSIIDSVKRNIDDDNTALPPSDRAHDEIGELADVIDPVFHHIAEIQANIRSSEERYRTIFENIQDVFYRVDLAGKIVMMSPKGAQKLGFSSSEEVIGKDAREFYSCSTDIASIENALRGSGLIQNYEINLRSKGGTPLTFYANSHYYYDKNGIVAGREGILHDVTELKRAEQELLESKERFRSLVETISDLIWEIDKDGHLTYISPKIRDILGYRPETLLGKTPFDMLPQEEAEKMAPVFTSYLDLKTPFSGFECTAYHADGHQVILETNGEPIFDVHGGFSGYRGVVRDVTRRKTIEKKLLDSEQSYRELFDAIREGIYILDPDHRFITVNEGAVRMNGYPREYYLGKTPEFLSDPGKNGPEYFVQHIKDALNGMSHQFEFWCIRGNGEVFPQVVSLTRGMYFGRDVIIAIGMDISERKKSEDAIRLVNKKLNLLSGITRHDIINQLQALMVYHDSSKFHIFDPDTLREIYSKEDLIIRNIHNQIGFTKDYEDLGVNAPKWYNIRFIIKKISNLLPVQQVTILEDNLNVELFADPLLEKVFYNLIQNAVSYGGENMDTIRISSSESAEGLLITVEDNGIGVCDEDKNRIFLKGFGKNTGLGLFLSREILSITSITIAERGRQGNGARFEIIAPRGTYRCRTDE